MSRTMRWFAPVPPVSKGICPSPHGVSALMPRMPLALVGEMKRNAAAFTRGMFHFCQKAMVIRSFAFDSFRELSGSGM